MQTNLFYPSVAAAKAAAMGNYQLPENGKLAAATLRRDTDNSRTWYGMAGGAKAVLASLIDGNADAESKVRQFHEAVKQSLPRAVGVNRHIVRGSMGDELDIHAVNRGIVDRAWSSRQRKLRKGSSILRLCIDICANSGTDAADLAWRGLAGLALSEIMTKAGYSVEIVAALAVGRHASGQTMTACTVIKPRTSSADIGLLAATVGNAGFFRTIGFCQIIMAADQVGKEANDSLGSYLDVSGILPVPDKVAQIFVSGRIHDRKTAMSWIHDTMKLLGA